MSPPLLIAEAGNNHEGSLDAALELLERAREAGADLVKFQAGTAEGFARTPEDIARYRKYELGKDGYDRLLARGLEIGVPVFFSIWSREFNHYYGLLWKKIAARQCDETMVKCYDSPNTFISIPHRMGMAAVKSLDIRWGVPMHCVTEYPPERARLYRIQQIRDTLGRDVGYSDHTLGIGACVDAIAMGAVAIEKHFTLRHNFGPLRDHALSATPEEFQRLAAAAKGGYQ